MLHRDRDFLVRVLEVHTSLAAAAVRWPVVGTEVVQGAGTDVLLSNSVHDSDHQISVVLQVVMGVGEYGVDVDYFFGVEVV